MVKILLEIHSIEELKNLITKSVKMEIDSRIKIPPNKEELLTTQQVCELLKFSRVTIWNLTKKGVITSYRIGKQLRYKRSEILKSLVKINH